MTWVPLKRVADVWPSNVDKLTVDGEHPVRLVNYTDVYYGDRLHPGIDLMAATATADEIARFRLQRGDVILTKDSETADDIGISAYVEEATRDMVCGYHLSLVRPRAAVGRYLHYAISSTHARRQLSVAATGVTRFGLRAESVGSLSVWIPSDAQQRAIADYLDAETARIDALIAKKQQLIHLLEERLADFVERRIFGGERRTRLDRLTDPYRPIMYGIVLPGPDVGEGVPIVKGGNVRGHKIGGHVCHTTVEIELPYARARLASGDLVVIIRGAGAGRVAEVHNEHTDWNITQDVARVAPASGVDSRWLRHVLEGRPTQEQLRVRVGGAAITGVNVWDLKRIEVPDVDPSEQTIAARDVGEAETRAAALTSALIAQLELLAEHRQALITAAVTGEFAVPAAA